MAAAPQQEAMVLNIGAWVASALAAERAAINQQLVKYHQTLLTRLDVDLHTAFAAGDLQGSFPSRPLSENSPIGAPIATSQRSCVADSSKAAAIGASIVGDSERDLGTDEPSQSNPSFNENGQTQESNEERPDTSAQGMQMLPPASGDDADLTGADAVQDIAAEKSDTPTKLSSWQSAQSEIHAKGFWRALAESPVFEAFFVLLVVLNTFVAALMVQYRGFNVGYNLGYSGYTRPAEDIWPGAKTTFDVLEIVFAVLYTVELAVKFLGLRFGFFKSNWNMFDLILVCLWYLTEFSSVSLIVNPLILRLARMARLMRLVKHVGWFQSFDSLHMIICAIKSSFSVLVWSTIILFMLLLVVSLALGGFLVDYLEDPLQDTTKRTQVYKYFGTFTRSLVTLFEISFASHVPASRTVMENVDEIFALFFMFYKCIVGLSVMKVITGVFLHETFKVCSEDDELMIIQKKRSVEEHKRKMERLFTRVDSSGDGSLSKEEFALCMKDEWVHTWLSAMDLDTSHVDRLWDLVDDGDGNVTAEELVKGVSKLKGAAKSVDMCHVVKEMDEMREMNNKILQGVGNTHANLLILAGRIEAVTLSPAAGGWLDPSMLLKSEQDRPGPPAHWNQFGQEYVDLTLDSI